MPASELIRPDVVILGFTLVWSAVSASATPSAFTGTFTGTYMFVGMSGPDSQFVSAQRSTDAMLGGTALGLVINAPNTWSSTPARRT